jgi:CheY-like chemotaxis protein
VGYVTEPLAGIRVFVVDDDDDTRVIMEEVLGYLGAQAMTAASAHAALALAPELDIIVTDIAMPAADGLWLLERINALPRPIPVIAMSGYAEQPLPDFERAPFARKLLKPVERAVLAAVIHDVLAQVNRA